MEQLIDKMDTAETKQPDSDVSVQLYALNVTKIHQMLWLVKNLTKVK